MMRILVTGAGAVGGYFGGRLAQAGRDVTFLVRPQRAKQLRERGLEIQSPHGNAQFQVNLVTAGEIEGPYDLVLLAVKTYALKRAIDDLRPAVGNEAIVLPTLNGVQHIDALSSAFGASHVFGGVCVVSTTVGDEGRIIQLSDQQELTYGELDGSRSERLGAVDAALQGAGLTARASSTIVLDMWEKWVFIAALGASTCLLRGSTGDILAAPRGRDLILATMNECDAVANAAGYPPRAEPFERFRSMLTDTKRSLTSSMYRDLQKGAKLEADAILGDMCRRGEAAHLTLPLLNAAFAQLSIYEGKHMQPALPEELRTALDAYRKSPDAANWTTLSQVEVNGTDVLDALKRFKPDFPDAYPLPVEDVVQDNAGFYEWPELPNPDDVLLAVTAVLKPTG